MRNTIPPLVLMMACTGNTEKVDGNGAPEIQSLVITGTDFGTSDTLTCTVQYSDPDGDVVTENYEWTNQRGDIIGTANTSDRHLDLDRFSFALGFFGGRRIARLV